MSSSWVPSHDGPARSTRQHRAFVANGSSTVSAAEYRELAANAEERGYQIQRNQAQISRMWALLAQMQKRLDPNLTVTNVEMPPTTDGVGRLEAWLQAWDAAKRHLGTGRFEPELSAAEYSRVLATLSDAHQNMIYHNYDTSRMDPRYKLITRLTDQYSAQSRKINAQVTELQAAQAKVKTVHHLEMKLQAANARNRELSDLLSNIGDGSAKAEEIHTMKSLGDGRARVDHMGIISSASTRQMLYDPNDHSWRKHSPYREPVVSVSPASTDVQHGRDVYSSGKSNSLPKTQQTKTGANREPLGTSVKTGTTSTPAWTSGPRVLAMKEAFPRALFSYEGEISTTVPLFTSGPDDASSAVNADTLKVTLPQPRSQHADAEVSEPLWRPRNAHIPGLRASMPSQTAPLTNAAKIKTEKHDFEGRTSLWSTETGPTNVKRKLSSPQPGVVDYHQDTDETGLGSKRRKLGALTPPAAKDSFESLHDAAQAYDRLVRGEFPGPEPTDIEDGEIVSHDSANLHEDVDMLIAEEMEKAAASDQITGDTEGVATV